MTLSIVRQTTIIIFCCNIIITSQDFLQFYQPRVGLPKPLNEWLSLVQDHKSDFKIIKNIARKRQEEQDYYDEKRETKRHMQLDIDEDEYIDDAPRNDIRPHGLQEPNKNPYENLGTTFDENDKNEKEHKNKINSNNLSRNRRELSERSFDESNQKLQLDNNGKQGEIKRLVQKYPGQSKSSDTNDHKKREIQIDILKDGKLVDTIKEKEKNSESIVLNIDTKQRAQLINAPSIQLNRDIKPGYLQISPLVPKNEPSDSLVTRKNYRSQSQGAQILASQHRGNLNNALTSNNNDNIKPLEQQVVLSLHSNKPIDTRNNNQLSNTQILSQNQNQVTNALTIDKNNFQKFDNQVSSLKSRSEPSNGLFANNYDPQLLDTLQKSLSIEGTNNNKQEQAYDNANLNAISLNSIRKDIDTKDNNVLVYHVTLTNPNAQQLTPAPSLIIQHAPEINNLTTNNFHRNNFKDMSKFWTASEKHQLRKGIQFAHDTAKNLRKAPTHISQLKFEDGFESANSIVVEHNHDKAMVERAVRNDQPVKRNLQPLEGNILLQSRQAQSNNPEIDLTSLELIANGNLDFNVPTQFPNKDNKAYHTDEMTPISISELIQPEQPQQQGEKRNADMHKRHENINNHIDITIIEPQKEEKTGENKLKSAPIDDNCDNELQEEQMIINNNEKLPIVEENISGGELTNNNDEYIPSIQYTQNGVQGEVIDFDNDEKPNIKSSNFETELDSASNEREYDEDEQDSCVGCSYKEPEKHSDEVSVSIVKENHLERNVPKTHHQKKHDGLELAINMNNDRRRYLLNGERKRYTHSNKKTSYCRGENCNNQLRNRHKKRHNKRKPQLNNKYKDSSQSFKSRQLKSSDYEYDADLVAPVHKRYNQKQPSSERTRYFGIKKEVVEGDYGDEEDSIPIKNNYTKSIIKQSDNVFANPLTTSSKDEDDEDYYNDIEGSNEISKITLAEQDESKSTAKFHSSNQQPGFGKRKHDKHLSRPVHRKHKNEQKAISEKTVRAFRSPQSQIIEDDFRQLPNFVKDNQMKEENLHKRSYENRKKTAINKFPLASKGFFTNNNEMRRDLNAKKELIDTSPQTLVGNIKLDTSNTGVSISVPSNIGKNERETFTLVNFNDIPGVSFNTSAVTESTTTSKDQCEDTKVTVDICENEYLNHSQIVVTTMLSIIPDVQSNMEGNNTSISTNDTTFEKLDEVLSGRLPIVLVNSIFDHLKEHPTYKTRFYDGMRRRHDEVSTDALTVANQERSKEVIRIMQSVIDRLEWSANCQLLSPKYRRYLKSITRAKTHDALAKTKQMEEIAFDDSQNVQNFIFTSGVSGVEEKKKILRDLLDKFEHLPEDCKKRAIPVKKYIEHHLIMLDRVSNSPVRYQRHDFVKDKQNVILDESKQNSAVNQQQHPQPIRRNEPHESDELVQQQLDSLGLGKNRSFKPKFDLDELIHKSDDHLEGMTEKGKNEIREASKKEKKRDLGPDISDKYEKLVEAVRKVKIKNERKKRLIESFGKLSIEDYNGENSNNIVKDVFESPLVYTL